MKYITYSVPAKIILSGEHGVVYGKPALVTAINKRITINLSENTQTYREDTQQNRSVSAHTESQAITEAFKVVHTAVKDYLEKNAISFIPADFVYSIENEIPIGRGMGSSAAFAVAASAAILHAYTGGEYPKEIINQIAYSCEKHFHGNPSGVDNSAVCYGGLVFFRKEFEFLKNISALNFKLPRNIEQHLFLIDTGKPVETTAEMVALVGKHYNKDAKQMETSLNAMEKITKRMVVSIVKEDAEFFRTCIAENQTVLEDIGVVSESAKKLMKSLQQFGVGKVTGAGGAAEGSGFVLFFADDPQAFRIYLDNQQDAKHISYFTFEQDFEGVKNVRN